MKQPVTESRPVTHETPCQSHLLTFDVEHWYEGFRYRGVDGWQSYPPRDDQMVGRLLDMLAETGQRATMFFTGRYAEEFPDVVRRAAREEHEIASHSYSHRLISNMSGMNEFREDLSKSVALLEDISGCKIKGYRAPKWSISEQNRQDVLSILVEAGIEYDSSVFPGFLDGSGAMYPHQVALRNGGSIWEIPATTYPLFGLRVPVAGGLYFRFFPAWVTRMALSSCSGAGQPGMIYLHPYDMDAACPRLSGGNFLFHWLRYCGVEKAFDRLKEILKQHRFGTVLDWVTKHQVLDDIDKI